MIAGFIDSIAGGGGLITLPIFSIIFGPGPHAIGTNKIVATLGAFVALCVYLRKRKADFKRSITFTLWVALGALLGSRVAPLVPEKAFFWLLMMICPVILWVIWNKNLWIRNDAPSSSTTSRYSAVMVSGLLCGFYDGVFGPGGGTFMFLALMIFAKLPLLAAIAASKLANTCSAAAALASYYEGGYVHWEEGLMMASGVVFGAFIGATLATHNAARIVRPILLIVVSLLLFRLYRL